MSYRDKVIETELCDLPVPPRHQPLHIQCEDGVILHVSNDYVLETGSKRNAVTGWHIDAGRWPLVADQDEHGVVSFSQQPRDADNALHNYIVTRNESAMARDWIGS